MSIESPSGNRGPALYEFRAVRLGVPLVLPRLLRPDSTGVLSIGETGQFETRRKQFLRGVNSGAGHSEANLIWMLRHTEAVRDFLDDTQLEYRFRSEKSKADAVAREREHLWDYAVKFGEVPPFNSAFPGRNDQIADRRRKAR